MDTLHETKKWNTLSKDYTHGKTCPQFFYNIVFRGRHSWRNRNRRRKEGGRRFSIPLYCCIYHLLGSPQTVRSIGYDATAGIVLRYGQCSIQVASRSTNENAVKGEIPTGAEGWLHGGAILVTVCFKSRFECPCRNHLKLLGKLRGEDL